MNKTPRLAILTASLAKKKAAFDTKIAAHFEDVKSANGQPLNDKANGAATVSRWDRQNNALRGLQSSIQRTESAIERERNLIADVEGCELPDFLVEMLKSGELTQWRKHPETLFVAGVDKGRIVWDSEVRVIRHRYVSEIPADQYPKFRDACNKANAGARALRAAL